MPVEKDYSFETEHGTKPLAELFDGRSQLLVYHFMFGPQYAAGCPVCSSIADPLAPQVAHLKARDTTLLLASRAPIEKLLAYRERMGWDIGWVSSGGGDFNRDLGFLSTTEELRPSLEGEIPPVIEQMADATGTDVAGYVSEGPGSTARHAGAKSKENSSTGSAATTSTNPPRASSRCRGRRRPRRGYLFAEQPDRVSISGDRSCSTA